LHLIQLASHNNVKSSPDTLLHNAHSLREKMTRYLLTLTLILAFFSLLGITGPFCLKAVAAEKTSAFQRS